MIAIYRALLRLYPSGFRTEYGPELCGIFESRLRNSSGPLSRTFLVIAAVIDTLWNAIAAHMDILRQDIRYTARALRRSPGFTFTAIAVVALGVGANTAAFSLADFVLLRPLPYPESNRLVKLWQSSEAFSQNEVSPSNYRDWRAMTLSSPRSSFRDMGAYTRRSVNLVGEGQPRRLQSVAATPEVLRLVGVPAMIGRIMTTSEIATAVISHELWRSHFGADPSVLGRAVRLDGSPHTIIGVMPATFHFPSREVELWTPLVLTGEDFEDRNNTYLEVVARLAPGATVDGAIAEMKTVAARLEQQYPAENEDVGVLLHRLKDQMSRRSRVLILALCGASLCILLLACANLASLLLARGIGRTRELAVRNTLGAGRERLVRQFITESLTLAFMGGLVGVATAMAGLPLLARLVPTGLPIGEVPMVDLRVLAFAALLVGITGLGFGVAPALRAGQSGAIEALREAGRSSGGRRQRMRSMLVVLQVTGSIVLLISSGLLMRAVWRIQSIAPGFDAEGVMTLRTALPLPKYAMTADRVRFYSRVLEDVRALPGIESAAYITGLPMDKRGGIWPIVVGGANAQRTQSNSASLRFASAEFFKTLGIPLRRGRDIARTDSGDRPYVAVVSESFVKRHWPGQDPIGRQFGFALSDRTVVGVVGDVRVRGLEQSSEPQVYLPLAQVPDNSLIGYLPQDLVIRSTLPAESWLPSIRRIISSADPEQPVSNIRPVSEILADDTAPRRVQLNLLMILSALALVIAGVGIHGLLSFTVSQRTQELGIRRALGAQAGTIVSMVLREGLRVAVVGTLIGVAAAIMVGRGMSALLFGIAPADPQTIAAAVALCFLTVLIGCLPPAVRAARVDPITALRESGG